MELELKTARPEMEQDWHGLWEMYLAFYGTNKPESVYAASWARILDSQSPMHSCLLYTFYAADDLTLVHPLAPRVLTQLITLPPPH